MQSRCIIKTVMITILKNIRFYYNTQFRNTFNPVRSKTTEEDKMIKQTKMCLIYCVKIKQKMRSLKRLGKHSLHTYTLDPRS